MSTDLPRPDVTTIGRSLTTTPVLSIRMWGLSMTFLRHVRPASEVSPEGYPGAAKSMPAKCKVTASEGKSGAGRARKYTAQRAVREEDKWRWRRPGAWQT